MVIAALFLIAIGEEGCHRASNAPLFAEPHREELTRYEWEVFKSHELVLTAYRIGDEVFAEVKRSPSSQRSAVGGRWMVGAGVDGGLVAEGTVVAVKADRLVVRIDHLANPLPLERPR